MADSALAAAQLSGKGMDGSFASNLLGVLATASGRLLRRSGLNRIGRSLLATNGVDGCASYPAAELQSTLAAMAASSGQTATPATGPVSVGQSGLYYTVANLMGHSYATTAIAAGADMEPVGASGSTMKAVDYSAANAVLQFDGPLAGACALSSTGDDGGGINTGVGSSGRRRSLSQSAGSNNTCSDSVVAVQLFYYESAAGFLSPSSSSDGRRRLHTGATALASDDVQLLSAAVEFAVSPHQAALPCAAGSGKCAAILSIPVPLAYQAESGWQLACVKLECGQAFAGTQAAGSFYLSGNASDTAAECTLTETGVYALAGVRTTSLQDAPPSSPSPSPSSSPSPAPAYNDTCSNYPDALMQRDAVAVATAMATSATGGQLSAALEGVRGVYITAANLLGQAYAGTQIAAGSTTKPSGADGSMNNTSVAVVNSSTNAVLQFSGPLAGQCDEFDIGNDDLSSRRRLVLDLSSSSSSNSLACSNKAVAVTMIFYGRADGFLTEVGFSGSRRRLKAATDEAVPAGVFQLLSGAVEFSAGAAADLPCAGGKGSCTALLRIPLSDKEYSPEDGWQVGCIKLECGEASAGRVASDGFYPSSTSSAGFVDCVVSNAGVYASASFPSLPETPKPSPSPSSSPSPVPAYNDTCSNYPDALMQRHAVAVATAMATSATGGQLSAALEGVRGVYITAANLLGQAYAGTQIAAGSTTKTSGADGSMNITSIAVVNSSTNAVLQFSGPLAGQCDEIDIGNEDLSSRRRLVLDSSSSSSSNSLACSNEAVAVTMIFYGRADGFLTEVGFSGSRRRLKAATDEAVPAGVFQLLSGAVEFSAGAAADLPCAGSKGNCTALLRIPLFDKEYSPEDGWQVGCLKLECGEASAGRVASDGFYPSSTSSAGFVDCVVSQAGMYALAGVPSLPQTPNPSPSPQSSPTPSPTPSPSPKTSPAASPTPSPSPSSSPNQSPSPSPAPQGGTPEVNETSPDIAAVVLAIQFPIDFNTLMSNDTAVAVFKAGIISGVAAAARVPEEWVIVKALRAGSVIADVMINLPLKSYTGTEAAAVVNAVIGVPDKVFDQLKRDFNITGSITATAVSVPTNDGGRVNEGKPVRLGVGIGVGLGVGLVLLATVAVYTIRKKRTAGTTDVPQSAEAYQLASEPGPDDSSTAAALGDGSIPAAVTTLAMADKPEGTTGVITRSAASVAKANSGKGRGKKATRPAREDPELVMSEGTQI